MRLIIDECVDPRVRLLFADHQVATVHERGWDALEDGPLLKIAQQEFDVLLTIDGNLEFQQNLSNLHLGIIVVHVPENQLIHYRLLQKRKGCGAHPKRSRNCFAPRSVLRESLKSSSLP
jgi:hypothetical protein